MDNSVCVDIAEKFLDVQIYKSSVFEIKDNVYIAVIKLGSEKKLLVVNEQDTPVYTEFNGEEEVTFDKYRIKIADLNHHNAEIVRKYLPFTAPISFGCEGMSMGLGDRLGIASPGHIKTIAGTKVRPVLAQQSVRECVLTNRTFADVLDAATWGVLQEGYKNGFGADGDHLKTSAEVQEVIDLGYSMLTLDCSEKIDNTIADMDKEQVARCYDKLPDEVRKEYENTYLGKSFIVGKNTITFSEDELREVVLIYRGALVLSRDIYFNYIEVSPKQLDFEISIDETMTPTTPQAHYFVANELEKAKIRVTSLAPRFCGEFQKAIDYIGDIVKFEKEFTLHAAIADHFGYRLSIHSGSDKLSVYPIIGKNTKGRVHVKTAGTNWLEALRVISRKNPDLFRRICRFAREHFHEATAYYHVTTDISKVPDFETLPDKELEVMLMQNDARQLLHITYGLILTAKDEQGMKLLRKEIYDVLNTYEEEYEDTLQAHIGKHIKELVRELV